MRTHGLFGGLKALNDERVAKNERQAAIERQRRIEDEDRTTRNQRDALTLEMRLRDSGYVPEGEVQPELPSPVLDDAVSEKMGMTATGPAPSRYGQGPRGYRYDRQSRAAQDQSLEQRLREAQLRALEAPKVPTPRQSRTTDRGIEEFDPGTGQWAPTGRKPYQAPREPREPTPVNWETRETDHGFVQVHPQTGQTRPLGIQGKTKDGDTAKVMTNVKDALDDFETVLIEKGSVVSDGVDKAVLQTAYENVQLQMKELFNLGVLAGPDLELMRRVLNDPTSAGGRMRAWGSGDRQKEKVMAQIQQVRGILARYANNAAPAGGAGRSYDVPNPR